MPGRGAYVCDQPACIEGALTKGALGRALKTPIPGDLQASLVTAGSTISTIEGGARGQE
jgi:predicted RNA-binding protein YlxR (DUF448 family)